CLGAHNGSAAGAVLHHEGLVEPPAELVGNQTSQNVVAARRTDRHHDLNWMIGIVLRANSAGTEQRESQSNRQSAARHLVLPKSKADVARPLHLRSHAMQ